MKLLISLISTFFSFSLMAGGSSGGGVGPRPDVGGRIINPQTIADFGSIIKTDPTIRIIHGAPSLNGVSRVSVGRIDNNQWQVQTIDIPDDLLIQSDLSQEIQKSIDLNDWVEIQSTNP